MRQVPGREFDFFLGGKEFTTKTLLPMGAVQGDNKLDDVFFDVGGVPIAKQKCDNGTITYWIDEGVNK